MKKQIDTSDAPKAIGPYSQAVATEQFLFVSGQIPVNPRTGKIDEMSIEWQTGQVFRNLEAILAAAGLTFADVVKAEVFLKDMDDFQKVNAIYAEKFAGPVKPARQTVEVARLPMDALIEISCIAILLQK